MTRRLLTAGVVATILSAGCSHGHPSNQPPPVPPPASPLPTAGIAGQDVSVYPITLLAVAEELHWDTVMPPRRVALDRADSMLGALLTERSPEVTWVLPPKLRRDAAQAPGMLVNPDQMGTALLRSPELTVLPDPLRSQMRNLTGMAGGRWALVPAALLYVPAPNGEARVELTLLLADVRTGIIGWRTVANATGTDPWVALRVAIKSLQPGLP